MPLIWCAISAHGYGHAAQIIPVLNALHRRVAGLRIILRTQVPARFFEGRLHPPWELNPAQQDVGCVQHGPLEIDIKVTWEEHRRFHAGRRTRLAEETRLIRAHSPVLVLSDIPYTAIEAGAQAGTSCAGLCSLSWDKVLEPFVDPTQSDQVRILKEITESYRRADLMIRPMPGLPLSAFRRVRDVGPIADPLPGDPSRLRRLIGAGERERVVLIGFGGIALASLPFERLEEMAGYRFIVSGTVPQPSARLVPDASIPLRFRSLLASADILITKPGYSTITEAVASNIPMVYVRRFNFADEAGLIEYAHRYGRAVELPAHDFAAGRWESALERAYDSPPPADPAPRPTGADEAAEMLLPYLTAKGRTG